MEKNNSQFFNQKHYLRLLFTMAVQLRSKYQYLGKFDEFKNEDIFEHVAIFENKIHFFYETLYPFDSRLKLLACDAIDMNTWQVTRTNYHFPQTRHAYKKIIRSIRTSKDGILYSARDDTGDTGDQVYYFIDNTFWFCGKMAFKGWPEQLISDKYLFILDDFNSGTGCKLEIYDHHFQPLDFVPKTLSKNESFLFADGDLLYLTRHSDDVGAVHSLVCVQVHIIEIKIINVVDGSILIKPCSIQYRPCDDKIFVSKGSLVLVKPKMIEFYDLTTFQLKSKLPTGFADLSNLAITFDYETDQIYFFDLNSCVLSRYNP